MPRMNQIPGADGQLLTIKLVSGSSSRLSQVPAWIDIHDLLTVEFGKAAKGMTLHFSHGKVIAQGKRKTFSIEIVAAGADPERTPATVPDGDPHAGVNALLGGH